MMAMLDVDRPVEQPTDTVVVEVAALVTEIRVLLDRARHTFGLS